jgi:hypothetical protein
MLEIEVLVPDPHAVAASTTKAARTRDKERPVDESAPIIVA